MSKNLTVRKRQGRIILYVLLILYLVALCYLLFFSEEFGRHSIPADYPKMNLVPFREIQRFILRRQKIGTLLSLLNTAGNVIGFMPMGCFISLLFRRMNTLWKVTRVGFLCSLLAESLQYIFQVGIFDVDDMILNTMGSCLGYAVTVCFHKVCVFYKQIRKGKK